MKRSSLLRNERGVAMLMALTSITVLAVLAAELVYETEVYHRIVYNNVDQIRAQALAKSGLKLAKLQVIGTKKAAQALQQLGAGVPITQSDLDMIWQTPLVLPPPLPPNAGIGTRDAVAKLTKELELPGVLFVSTQGESGKFNLNRLVWKANSRSASNAAPNNGANASGSGSSSAARSATPATAATPELTLAEATARARKSFTQLINELLKQKRDSDEDFRLRYETLTGEQIIGNILAWIDPKTEVDGEGGPKQGYYRELDPTIEIKNAPLYSLSELNMVKDMDDTLVEFLSQHFTALQTEGLNINSIDETTIKALFPRIADDQLKKLAEQRALGPFAKVEDFWKFMQGLGFGNEDKKELDDQGISITTSETAFRVSIEAKSGDSRKVWVAHLGAAPPKLTTASTPGAAPVVRGNGVATGGELVDEDERNKTNAVISNNGSENDNGMPVVVYLKTD